ncbi:hypothetical protein DRQ15_05020 [candidate division KSB1 bacterium]|nr:MAG: hypothetical protein DRQ15_05015 [candidate division KSB1 bacterium]RKY91418.1 MAG: hypothetical protein DRQ15_05020 [candidate division KSB1 bacterium]
MEPGELEALYRTKMRIKQLHELYKKQIEQLKEVTSGSPRLWDKLFRGLNKNIALTLLRAVQVAEDQKKIQEALDEVALAFSKEIRELASEAVEVLIARVGFDENGVLRISLPVEPVPGLQKKRLEIKLAHRDLAAYDPQLAETSGWARQRKAGQAIVEGYMMLYGAGAKDGGQQVNFKPDRFQGPP